MTPKASPLPRRSPGAERLAAAGVASPRVDAELLVGTRSALTRSALYSERGRELSEQESARARAPLVDGAPRVSRSRTFSASGGSAG